MSAMIAKRYAKALFNFADEKENKGVYTDLCSLLELCRESAEFRRFIGDPILSAAKKEETLKELFQGKVKPQTLRFLLFLSRKNRLKLLQPICAAFEELYLSSNNIFPAMIRSKIPLTQTQIDQISKKFKQSEDKDIEPHQVVDERMLGGFTIQVKDMVYDHSIESKLNKFKYSIINQ